MYNSDWFNKIKNKLIILDLMSVSRVDDILSIYTNYPDGFDEINLSESYEKIRKINELNLSSLRELLNYVDFLEDSSVLFSKEDLLTMVENLSLAYNFQDKFVLDTINYILVEENVITDQEDITDKLNSYLESNSVSYDLVTVTNKRIKRKIKKERSDNLE